MKLLWKCTWENGFVSFVLGRSKVEAITVLRTELDADVPDDALEPVDHRASFYVTFTPCYEKHELEEGTPHWHADDFLCSQGIELTLGQPPPLPTPKSLPPKPDPDDDEPPCQTCGHARWASVHHPDYTKPNKCAKYEPRAAQIEPTELGPSRPHVRIA